MLTHLGGWLFCKDSAATTEKRSRSPRPRQRGIPLRVAPVVADKNRRNWRFVPRSLVCLELGFFPPRFWATEKTVPKIWRGILQWYTIQRILGNPFPKMLVLSLGRCFSKAEFGYFCEEFEARKKGILHHGHHIHHYRPLLWRLMTIPPQHLVLLGDLQTREFPEFPKSNSRLVSCEYPQIFRCKTWNFFLRGGVDFKTSNL